MSTSRAIRLAAEQLAAIARGLLDGLGDTLAQTTTYGLLLKRLQPSLDCARLLQGVPPPVLLDAERGIAAIDLGAVVSLLAADNKDPAIYLFPEFVRAYDLSAARSRGVHYSPTEVVSCIVRGAGHLLHECFDSSMDDALVVDPCCGVGTFLRYIDTQTACSPRMIGIEMSLAVCEIASCLVRGASVVNGDWLATDTLDTGGRVLVILGNPPYSGHSANPGRIADLMLDYRHGLNERNPKWLQDDYVKFIRMAQRQIETAGRGIVAFITNHSYLTNLTFGAMRRSLANTFDRIFVLDLQGNVKRRCGPDENVFPIQMGVAISFFVKTGAPGSSAVRHCSVTGSRRDKLRILAGTDFPRFSWRQLDPVEPFSVFTPLHRDLTTEYHSFASLFDIFGGSTIGFVTSRDAFAICFTRDEIIERMARLREGRMPDIDDPDLQRARQELLDDPRWEDRVIEVLYRPFDRRWTYYSRAIMERPRLPFMENLMKPNVALAIGRAGHATGSDEWDVVFCTDRPTDLNLFRRGGAKLFPRYVYRGSEKISNISDDFRNHDSLFAYIYAVLHSTAYRGRYRDLLQIDYPRIPIAGDDTFQVLAQLGSRLLNTHLLRAVGAQANSTGTIRIGGYELPDRWLRARPETSTAEMTALVRSAVAETLSVRAEIDAIIEQDPPWQ